MSIPTHYSLPTLSAAGWEDNPEIKLSKLLALFQASDRSQASRFLIASLPYCITSAGSDMIKLKQLVEDDLNRLLGCGYFDQTSITVTVENILDDQDKETGNYNLIYDIRVMQDSKWYSAGAVVELVGNEISKIVDIINR